MVPSRRLAPADPARASCQAAGRRRTCLNADKIRYVEQTPDTVVCCDTGERMMVKETLAEVTRRAIEYARVIRRPITD